MSRRVDLSNDAVDASILGQQITFPFSKRIACNRFLKGPMTERLCTWDDEDITKRGIPTKPLLKVYEAWADGQIGVIVGGNMMIQYDALEAFGNPVLCDNHDNRLESYKALVKEAKSHGSLFISQISHPGRQCSVFLNPNPVSASDVKLDIHWPGNKFDKPKPLTKEGIADLVKKFGETAYLCHEAGYDGVEIHGAHGYLIAQFLSLTTNLRTDEYGGSLDNRARFLFEIIEEVRRRVPDPSFIIGVKLNSVEFQDKGTTPEEARDLCIKLEAANVDFVDLSGGTYEASGFFHRKDSTIKREAYFIEFAEMIRPHLKKTIVYITGGFRSTSKMVEAVEKGSCDGIGLARPLTAEPHLVKHILAGKYNSALNNKVVEQYQTFSSGTQLHQIGNGEKEISDFSREEEAGRFHEALQKDTEKNVSILPRVESSGFPPLNALHKFLFRH